MYILNIASTIKNYTQRTQKTLFLKTFINKWNLLKKTYYLLKHQKKKDLQLFATKLAERIPDPCNAKEHYQSFLRKKNTKPVKRSKIVNQQAKLTESPNRLID